MNRITLPQKVRTECHYVFRRFPSSLQLLCIEHFHKTRTHLGALTTPQRYNSPYAYVINACVSCECHLEETPRYPLPKCIRQTFLTYLRSSFSKFCHICPSNPYCNFLELLVHVMLLQHPACILFLWASTQPVSQVSLAV